MRVERPVGRVLRSPSRLPDAIMKPALWFATGVLALGVLFSGALVLAQTPPSKPVASEPAAGRQAGTTVIVLRHAEKDPDGEPSDPGLGELGRKRSAALVRTLGRSGATHFFASEFKRTQETLAPLAAKLGGRVEVLPAREQAKLVERLRALPPGSVSVVAGHSNTVPALVLALGGSIKDLEQGANGAVLRESEYGRLFVLTLPPRDLADQLQSNVAELAYGD